MVRAQSNAKNQRRASTDAWDAQRLSLRDARGNLHIDLALAAMLVERDAPLGACKCLFNRDVQVTGIGIVLGEIAAADTCARARARAAKQTGEEIAKAIEIRESLAARVSKALRPVRRWPKLLSIAKIAAQLVVRSAFVAVAQDLVGLLDLFEFLLRILFLADIRMEFAGQLAVRALHFLGVGAASYPKNFVVVPILHA